MTTLSRAAEFPTSYVTVVPAETTTTSLAVGTRPADQVLGLDQAPLAVLLIVGLDPKFGMLKKGVTIEAGTTRLSNSSTTKVLVRRRQVAVVLEQLKRVLSNEERTRLRATGERIEITPKSVETLLGFTNLIGNLAAVTARKRDTVPYFAPVQNSEMLELKSC